MLPTPGMLRAGVQSPVGNRYSGTDRKDPRGCGGGPRRSGGPYEGPGRRRGGRSVSAREPDSGPARRRPPRGWHPFVPFRVPSWIISEGKRYMPKQDVGFEELWPQTLYALEHEGALLAVGGKDGRANAMTI